jgi:hypothetical protein
VKDHRLKGRSHLVANQKGRDCKVLLLLKGLVFQLCQLIYQSYVLSIEGEFDPNQVKNLLQKRYFPFDMVFCRG